MKLSQKQKKIQEKIRKLLLAGIPLVTLIPSKSDGREISQSVTRGEPPPPIRTTEKVPAEFKGYIVRKNDSLRKIAKLHHTTVNEICKANGIPPSGTLKIGQLLLIPVKNIKQEKKSSPMPVGVIAAPEKSDNRKQEKPPARIRGKK